MLLPPPPPVRVWACANRTELPPPPQSSLACFRCGPGDAPLSPPQRLAHTVNTPRQRAPATRFDFPPDPAPGHSRPKPRLHSTSLSATPPHHPPAVADAALHSGATSFLSDPAPAQLVRPLARSHRPDERHGPVPLPVWLAARRLRARSRMDMPGLRQSTINYQPSTLLPPRPRKLRDAARRPAPVGRKERQPLRCSVQVFLARLGGWLALPFCIQHTLCAAYPGTHRLRPASGSPRCG